MSTEPGEAREARWLQGLTDDLKWLVGAVVVGIPVVALVRLIEPESRRI